MNAYIFFDTETTGIPPRPYPTVKDVELWPRVVQIHWEIRDETGAELEAPASFILRPDGFVIPDDAARVHGISQAIAEKNGHPRQKVFAQFADKVRNAVPVAHNFDFDAPIIEAELLRLNVELPLWDFPHICTMWQTLDFCAIPSPHSPGKLKPPKLSELFQKVFGEDFSGAHDAGNDVRAMAACFYELKKRGHAFGIRQRKR